MNTQIQFENGFATESGMVLAYHADSNHIYIGSQDTFVSIGCGLPAGAYLDGPAIETKENEVIVRDGDKWIISPDFRGQTFYSTETGESVEITKLGEVSNTLTSTPKPEGFYKWSGSDWVEDTEVKQAFIKEHNTALKIQYFSEAKEKIEVLQDTIDFGMGDDSTEALLKNWKKYRILLNQITDLTQENITWPVKPE